MRIRIADGKLVELWNCQQMHEFVLQLGAKLIIPSEAKGTPELALKLVAEFSKNGGSWPSRSRPFNAVSDIFIRSA